MGKRSCPKVTGHIFERLLNQASHCMSFIFISSGEDMSET